MAAVAPVGMSPRYDSLSGGIPDLNVDQFLISNPVANGDFASPFIALLQTRHRGSHSQQERISWVKTSYRLVIEQSITDPTIKQIALQTLRFFDEEHRESTVDCFSYEGPQATKSSIEIVQRSLIFNPSDPISFFIEAYRRARDCVDPKTEEIYNSLILNIPSESKTAASFVFQIFAAIENDYMISPLASKKSCCPVL